MASWSGNIRVMYEGIKQASGKPTKRSALLKSKTEDVIKDRNKQMSRWVEHYLDIYSRENSVAQEALHSIKDLPVLEELDSEPTLEKLCKAIDALASGKALVRTAFTQKLSNAANLHYWSHFAKSCVCDGEKARCPRTCVMPRSLPCTKIRVITATATTTEASPCLLRGLCQSGFSQTPGPRKAHLHRIPVRLQNQEIHSGHILLHSTAP